jgi:hypothetical protein
VDTYGPGLAIGILIIGWVMRQGVFSKSAAYLGVITGVLGPRLKEQWTTTSSDQRTTSSIKAETSLRLNIIRTETVFSRLPVHNLTKNGRVDIQIIRKSETGEVDLK